MKQKIVALALSAVMSLDGVTNVFANAMERDMLCMISRIF